MTETLNLRRHTYLHSLHALLTLEYRLRFGVDGESAWLSRILDCWAGPPTAFQRQKRIETQGCLKSHPVERHLDEQLVGQKVVFAEVLISQWAHNNSRRREPPRGRPRHYLKRSEYQQRFGSTLTSCGSWRTKRGFGSRCKGESTR